MGGDGTEIVHPEGATRIAGFGADPWPRWTFRLGDADGTTVEQEIFVSRATGATVLAWRLRGGASRATLEIRPLLSGRDYHSLHAENPVFRFEPAVSPGVVVWSPYAGVPPVRASGNFEYAHDPVWYRGFAYAAERERGLDFREDLASPGVLRFDLSGGEAVLVLEAADGTASGDDILRRAEELRAGELSRRAGFPSRLHRAGDDYLVRRGEGRTIVAGYPWFTDWGRDTFIAIRGLCLATGRFAEARDILIEWAAGAVSEGMLPNRFPDGGEEPEYNAVDASLWYVVAAHEWLAACRRRGVRVAKADRAAVAAAIEAILSGYSAGTRYGIRADSDGLLAAGVPGVQLTWMDAKVGHRVITPRIGKPVEVQALWINALTIGALTSERWAGLAKKACASFVRRFWREDAGCLFDVVDCDHVPGTADPAFRPNQILAVGGLPFPLLPLEQARRVVEQVESRLWTPLGLRSLAPEDPAYAGRYAGSPAERDGVYHQGTVWPWLAGPFVEAWIRVRDGEPGAKSRARKLFLEPLLAGLDSDGIGHVPEIADGDPPHRARGCPFQAWSVGEALRLDLEVLAEGDDEPASPRAGEALCEWSAP